MTDRLSIALAQINPTVGAITANIDRIRTARAEAAARGADLMVCPELAVTGYPPEDLVLKPFFLDVVERAVRELAAETADGGPALLVGAPWRDGDKRHNAALLLDGGRIAATRFKVDLPNYGVFDEKRVFDSGPLPGPINVRGVRLGVPICEDMWSADVIETLAESGAEILVVPNGSPFELGKHDQRVQLAVRRVTDSGLPLLYVNQVGGQDELVFDGSSFALGADCRLVAQAPAFAEHLLITRWERGEDDVWSCADTECVAPPDELEAVYAALVLALRDYVAKNRFPGVILGLSGGIDSALAAAIAVDALGAERVHGVMMPSPHTAPESQEDAAESAELLGCRLDTVSILLAMEAFERMLRPAFAGRDPDVTEENIQARSRGVTLMALSNKFGPMVLSTGNKSEMSVGYATLYGDLCGGFAVLKDVYKTTVYALARWRNAQVPQGALGPAGRVVPERVLVKAPTAELSPGQTDQDTLPPYEALDDILRCLIEEDLGVAEIVARGHAPEVVNAVWGMLHSAEYKRRQAPPGPKITRRQFGRERRYPITNGFGSLL
ncbi:NAD+ synthase [Azospirillum argentinense]|uniref:Glutamine-dependent NAD(+) synthetase n=1 Tax=Azospirillum argentinense TaxID=2970906 RepID=A0A5B0L1G4_9PROT|nr:NAD+ synthase [Azospirillum argentinense]KAA1058145.1 NAD synthetase, Glutamine amidotransferase chain of NAD synthetase [Azospirillum argentinense]